MRNPQETDLKNNSDKETNLDFSLPEESRWLAFWENLKGLFVKAVASSVSATPAETDLLLASAVWYSTILGNLKSVLIGQRQPAISAHPVENSLLLKSQSRFRSFVGEPRSLVPNVKATASCGPGSNRLLLEAKPWFRTVFSELPALFGSEIRVRAQRTAGSCVATLPGLSLSQAIRHVLDCHTLSAGCSDSVVAGLACVVRKA